MIYLNICGYGGIGRRAGFRFQWATVQVQLLLAAPPTKCLKILLFIKVYQKENFMKEIDLNTWERKDIFNLYYQYNIPQISLCTPIEVTKVYKFAKSKGLSFYFCLCHVFYTALLKFEEYMIRSINGKIVFYDCIFANMCVMKQGEELFKIINFEYCPDIEKFCNEAKKKLQSQTTFIEPLPSGTRKSQAIAYMSCTPWFEFTHITHPLDVQRNSFIPQISFDKMKTNEKGERWINASIQVNHAAIDGNLIGKLLNEVKSIISGL